MVQVKQIAMSIHSGDIQITEHLKKSRILPFIHSKYPKCNISMSTWENYCAPWEMYHLNVRIRE